MIYMYLFYMKMIGYQKKQRSIRNTQKNPLTLHHPKTPTISLATLPSATSKVKHRFGSCVKKTTTSRTEKKNKKHRGIFRGRIFPCFLAKGLNSVKQPGGCLVDVCCFKAHCLVFVVPCLDLREINCLSHVQVKSGTTISRSFSCLFFSRRSLHACCSCMDFFKIYQGVRKSCMLLQGLSNVFFSVQVMSFSLFPIAFARLLLRCWNPLHIYCSKFTQQDVENHDKLEFKIMFHPQDVTFMQKYRSSCTYILCFPFLQKDTSLSQRRQIFCVTCFQAEW